MNRGYKYGNLGQYQQAIEDFSKVISLKPDFAEAYTNRAAAYGILGQYHRAIEDFNRVIELNPQDAGAYYGKACVYSLLKNPLEACKWLKISIEKGFNNWDHIKSNSYLNSIRSSSCYRQIMSGK